jgi:hypothetical protein
MANLNFERLTKNEVSSLIGHDRGLAARKLFQLDVLDREASSVEVAAPSSLEALTPSFVQGLFAASVHALGEDGFFKHYRFDRLDRGLLEDVKVGVQRVLMKREIAGAA